MQKAQKIMEQLEDKFRRQPPRLKAKNTGCNLDELLKDLKEDFNTELALEKLIDQSINNPSQSKAGFELLGFIF